MKSPAATQTRPPRRNSIGSASATLSVRIQPRASRNEIAVMEDGGFKVRLTAPPVDGAANEALIGFLAQKLSVTKKQVEILSGHTSRQKIVRISGICEEDLRHVLNDASKKGNI